MEKKGIIFTGGEFPPDSVVKKLCEKAGLIVCADSGWDVASRCNIRPDCVIGDFDSVKTPVGSKITVSRFSRAKDATDTELAFETAMKAGCRSVTVIGGGGGRIDHWLALWRLFSVTLQWTRWESRQETLFRVTAGETWCAPEGRGRCVVSVFALSDQASVITEGFRWSLTGLRLSADVFSLSNEVIKEGALLSVTEGTVAVILPRCDLPLTTD